MCWGNTHYWYNNAWRNQTHWGYICTVWFTDQSGYLLCGFCPFQRCVGDAVSGALEEARGRAGLQMGHLGHPRWILGGAQATVQGEGGLLVMFLHAWMWKQCLLQVHKNVAVFVQIGPECSVSKWRDFLKSFLHSSHVMSCKCVSLHLSYEFYLIIICLSSSIRLVGRRVSTEQWSVIMLTIQVCAHTPRGPSEGRSQSLTWPPSIFCMNRVGWRSRGGGNVLKTCGVSLTKPG